MTAPRCAAGSRTVRIGFVPLVDAAPFAVAEEMGIFARRGLRVRIDPQPGWATIRDKIIYRELDAAHAVCGLPYSALLGIGCIPSPVSVSLVLNQQGNVLILAKSLWADGVRDPRSLRLFAARAGRKPVLAVVSRFSAHHFLLRSWLRRGAIDPDRDVYIPVLPPAQMAVHLTPISHQYELSGERGADRVACEQFRPRRALREAGSSKIFIRFALTRALQSAKSRLWSKAPPDRRLCGRRRGGVLIPAQQRSTRKT